MARRDMLPCAALLLLFGMASAAQAGDAKKLDRLVLKRNYTAASSLALKQAEAGQAGAQYRYGMMLLLGLGTEADRGKAIAWLSRAAAGGSAKAALLLARLQAKAPVQRTALTAPPWKAAAKTPAPAVDPRTEDKARRSWLMLAGARGKADFIGDAAPDPAAAGQALIAAASGGQIGAAAQLLMGSSPGTARDSQGRTALILAASSPELVQLLIAAGGDLAARDAKGRDALTEAARRCASDSADLLIRAGASARADADQLTPLHHAVKDCTDPALVARLGLLQNADAPDRHGRTALWQAAASGKSAFIPVLMNVGAAVNLADGEGLTPLHAAAGNGEATAVTALLRAGAAATARTAEGDTALMLAAAAGCSDCVSALLDAKTEVDAVNARGDTALILAAKNQKSETVQQLLAAGADPDLRNASRETARAIAARIGPADLQKLFGP